MKVLIVSDTHRKNDLYLDILDKEKPDLVLHCGDSEGSEYALTAAADCPVHIVLGNNDFFLQFAQRADFGDRSPYCLDGTWS